MRSCVKWVRYSAIVYILFLRRLAWSVGAWLKSEGLSRYIPTSALRIVVLMSPSSKMWMKRRSNKVQPTIQSACIGQRLVSDSAKASISRRWRYACIYQTCLISTSLQSICVSHFGVPMPVHSAMKAHVPDSHCNT